MTRQKTVSVVIPSWNSESQLKQNLPAVFEAAAKVNAEVVIVDDHSTVDQSLSYLKSLGNKIRLYENLSNIGFSATVNRGVSESKGDVVVLLNTDVRPEPDCFVCVLKYFDDPTVYSVGFNSGEGWMGARWERGLFHHFRVEPKLNNKDQVNPTCWASGGQAAFDKKKWQQLGGMDLLYKPFYWEDTDMGYRSCKRGWQNLWAPDCRCVHDHQRSVISNSFTEEFITQVAQRNQFLFHWKNISDPAYLITHFIYLLPYLIRYPGPIFSALLLLPRALAARSHEAKHWTRSDHDILKTWSH